MCQQAAYAVALAGIDQLVNLLRGDQATRCIVYQHPVLFCGTTRQQHLEATHDGVGPGCATARHMKPGWTGIAVQKLVARSHRHQRCRQTLHTSERRQRMQHQRLPGNGVVLFGQIGRGHTRRNGACTDTGTRNQAPETPLREPWHIGGG